MRNRVNIIETKFHIDEENKVVVCILKCDMQMEKHPAWGVVDYTMWKRKFPNIGWAGRFTVKAISRCNDVDTFNVLTGKRIAESRAKIKMFEIAGKVWTLCTNKLIKLSEECLNSANACNSALNNESIHIMKLTQGRL